MNLIITIILVLIFSYVLTFLGKKIKIPSVVTLIFTGLIMSFPFIKNIIIEPNTKLMFIFGNIALICLMFLAGLESSWKIIYNERKDALVIAIFATLVPFFLGFIIFRFLGFSILISSVVGICMSITAEATKARVLLDLRKLRTKIGETMMGAGIIDDLFGLCFFILITSLLGVVNLKEEILIVGAIIFFFIGIMIQKNIGRNNSIIKFIEKILVIAIIPFFFISMGINFDLNSLTLNTGLLIIIIVIAISGKLIGTLLTKHFTKFSWRQLYLIGWGMNSRGAVELALALIAFRNNLISIELYSSLVIMALITTLIFPFIITNIIKKEPEIMG